MYHCCSVSRGRPPFTQTSLFHRPLAHQGHDMNADDRLRSIMQSGALDMQILANLGSLVC